MNSFFKMHLFFFQESPGSRHDWNKDYVVLIERLRNFKNSTSYQEKIEVYSKISTLYSNFIHSAQTYGKVIIEEAYLPDNQKTIPPISAGIAGGQKYIVSNIYFKVK